MPYWSKKTSLFCLLMILSKIIFCQNIIVSPYLQNVTQDNITIMWETATDGSGTVVWGETPFSLDSTATSTRNNVNGTSQIHTALIENLAPKTKYYYKIVMEDEQVSSLRAFITLSHPADQESIQLIAISDMQRDGSQPNKFNEIVEQGIIPIVNSEISTSLSDLEGIIIPGDLVVTGGTYSQWKNSFFNPSDSLSGYVPIYPVPGNHEYFGDGLPNFKHYFSLPQNGAPGLLEECWYKDISNVRIIGLNSNSGTIDQNTQLSWLDTVLTSACDNEHIDFVFAQLHHPYKSELWTPGENDFTGRVIDSLEVFTSECNKASIHFFGHTHGYSRGQSRDHKHLWVNVATAGGAIDNWGEFPNADYEEFVKSQDEYGFVLIDVEADIDPQFTLKRYGRGDQDVIENNVLRDEITILKNDIRPQTPLSIFPKGDTLATNCIQLKASEYVGLTDTIQASHWQIGEDILFDQPLAEEQWWQNENYYYEENLQAEDDLTDITAGNLAPDQKYYWRVRYRNQNLAWSDWSIPDSFYLGNDVDTLSPNLVVNGDAENGISSWTGEIEAIENADCNSVLPFEGSFNFAVGGVCANESSQGLAEQIIDLSSFETEINTDSTAIRFSAYIRDFSGTDLPEMYIELYDDGTLITTSAIIANSTSEWTKKYSTLNVPVGIDECRVFLRGTRFGGTDNDSYFDTVEAYLIIGESCTVCIGRVNEDQDQDGICSDIDCDDKDPSIYPGALEVCDGFDNNCDGFYDTSDTIQWTGTANDNLWSNPTNWDQNIIPLSCQHVLIDDNAMVTIDAPFACKSLEIASSNLLAIDTEGTLLVGNTIGADYPAISISGTMLINGELIVNNPQDYAIEIYGTLINNSKIKSTYISLESIIIKTGGRFDDLGKTILK